MEAGVQAPSRRSDSIVPEFLRFCEMFAGPGSDSLAARAARVPALQGPSPSAPETGGGPMAVAGPRASCLNASMMSDGTGRDGPPAAGPAGPASNGLPGRGSPGHDFGPGTVEGTAAVGFFRRFARRPRGVPAATPGSGVRLLQGRSGWDAMAPSLPRGAPAATPGSGVRP